ncbi:MAG: rhodanese-like domain-containing protein [Acidimicrobiia bacterium]|nr:rhodanese-like domain-containing protein [Acidimicrobiia bacterium]
MDVQTLAERRDEGAVLFDVRQPDEWEEVRAPGAVLVPLAEVPDRLGEFPTGERVHLICRSGARSMKAAEFLSANGVDAVNVAGGTMAWVAAGFPTDSGPAAG